MHCRHIATVLKSKNAEWKRIKETLTSSRQRSRQEIESVEINKDTINASYVTYDSCDTCDTYDACDDSTQLPVNQERLTSPSPSSTPVQTTTTFQDTRQSHLDTLVSLISDDSEFDEEETEGVVICADKEKENGDIVLAASVSVFGDHRIPQKRKSHSRGCPCCDKVYLRTLHAYLFFFSTIKPLDHHKQQNKRTPSTSRLTLHQVSGILHLLLVNKK